MKTVKIRIGSKKSIRAAFTVDVDRPETFEDTRKMGYSEEIVVAGFARALDIARQDRIGRPMFEAGDKDADIATAVQAYKMGETRGRVAREPVKVELPKGKKSFTPEEVAAILAAKNIQAVVA